MLAKRTPRGFSLIELLVTIAVMVILALLAAPSMMQYTESSKIIGTAELFYASAQQARTEAIRRNTRVELVLTDQAPVASNAGTTGLTTSGPHWMIRELPKSATDSYKFIEGKQGAEGGGRADGGTTLVIASASTSIQFGPVGALVGAGPINVDFSSTRSACAPLGVTRCLRVVVLAGGQARLCDPVVAAASDTRKC